MDVGTASWCCWGVGWEAMGQDVGCDGGAGSSSSGGGQGLEGRHLGGWELVLSRSRFGGRVEATRREGVGGRELAGSSHGEVKSVRPGGCASSGEAGVVTRPDPIHLGKKRRDGQKETRFPKNSRLVDLLCENQGENQQQQDSGMEQLLERKRCRQRMAKDGMGGVGNLRQRGWVSFLPSLAPSWGGGRGTAPQGREERAPQQTPLTEPPRLSAPSHLHTPPDPTHRVAGATFGTPLFSLFALFNPRGNMATDVFHVKVFFFWLRAIMDRYGLSDADAVSATPSPPEETGGGGAASMGGGRLVEVPLPTTVSSGVSSRPTPPPPSRNPPPPLLTRRK